MSLETMNTDFIAGGMNPMRTNAHRVKINRLHSCHIKVIVITSLRLVK